MKKAMTILLALAMLLSVAAFGTGTACAAVSVDTESILGVKENNVYVSELLGIQAAFDEDWYLLNDEETAQVMGYTVSQADSELLKEALESSGAVCDLYVVRMDDSGDNINLQMEDLGRLYGSFLSEEAYLTIALPKLEEGLKQLGVENLTLERQDYDFAGDTHQSVLVSGSSGGVSFQERIVLIKGGRYMASLSAFSKDSTRIDEMLSVFEPLEAPQDAEDAIGEKQGNRYESELLGIAVDFPENWYLLNAEETAQVMGVMADNIDDEALAGQLRDAGTACDLYAVAMDESGDNVNIQLENLGLLYGTILTPKQYANIALPQLKPALEQAGFQHVQVEMADYEFAGRDRVSLLVTGDINGVPVYERLILIKGGQYMGAITAFSTDLGRIDALFAQFREF